MSGDRERTLRLFFILKNIDMKQTICTIFFVLITSYTALSQLLIQDFSSSSVIADYVSASPDNGQFTEITSSGSGSSVAIVSGKLELARTSGNGCFITRTADFSPEPTLLKIVFDLAVPTVTTPQVSGAILRIGSGFTNGTGIPANTSVHTRIGINLTSSDNFQLRNIASSTNSASFSGEQPVTWWINNSGSTQSYMAPDGSIQTVANDKSDVWVENSIVFNEMNPATGSVSLTDLKLNYIDGFGTITFDNFSFSAESGLPIELANFDVTIVQNAPLLSFTTATERNNDYFSIERSNDGATFSEIGRVTGSGTTIEKQDYTYTDAQPLKGINYYRLKQVDFDGTSTYSNVVSVVMGRLGTFSVSPSPAADLLKVRFEESTTEAGCYEVFDQMGQLVLTGEVGAESNELNLDVYTLITGIYILRMTNGRETVSEQFYKQ